MERKKKDENITAMAISDGLRSIGTMRMVRGTVRQTFTMKMDHSISPGTGVDDLALSSRKNHWDKSGKMMESEMNPLYSGKSREDDFGNRGRWFSEGPGIA